MRCFSYTKLLIKYIYSIYIKCTCISINSKEVKKGAIFFGLQGDNYNGGLFVYEAIQNGAILAIIDNSCKTNYSHVNIIYVADALHILQLLASYHRIKNINIPLLCITGSNGKTTTKNLVVHVLSSYMNILTNYGNLNNHIGVPLTLLSKINYDDVNLIVIELGASIIGDISLLCDICKPDYGYITNFGYAHILGFKSLNNVILEKISLYNYLRSFNKKVFVNMDDEIQVRYSNDICKYFFSIKNKKANVFIKVLSNFPYISLMYENIKIDSYVIGKYNIYNICAAIAICIYFNIDIYKIKEKIGNFISKNNRSELIYTNRNNKIILDAYNANLTSMKAAISSFISLCMEYNKTNTSLSSICIIGDMHELGDLEKYAHINICNILLKNSMYINKFYLIGPLFYDIIQNNIINIFSSLSLFIKHLHSYPIFNSIILIKGSRKMYLEKLVSFL